MKTITVDLHYGGEVIPAAFYPLWQAIMRHREVDRANASFHPEEPYAAKLAELLADVVALLKVTPEFHTLAKAYHAPIA